MRTFGVRWGQVFQLALTNYDELPIGCAVFKWDPYDERATETNQGWLHVGYYIGEVEFQENGKTIHYRHAVIEAPGKGKVVKYTNLETSSFNFWGLLNGIDYV